MEHEKKEDIFLKDLERLAKPSHLVCVYCNEGYKNSY